MGKPKPGKRLGSKPDKKASASTASSTLLDVRNYTAQGQHCSPILDISSLVHNDDGLKCRIISHKPYTMPNTIKTTNQRNSQNFTATLSPPTATTLKDGFARQFATILRCDSGLKCGKTYRHKSTIQFAVMNSSWRQHSKYKV